MSILLIYGIQNPHCCCLKEKLRQLEKTISLTLFVENFVLERFSIQTSLRVLFDEFLGNKFQDAIELISMQPVASNLAAWKRMRVVEFMHMRYAMKHPAVFLDSRYIDNGDKDKKTYMSS